MLRKVINLEPMRGSDSARKQVKLMITAKNGSRIIVIACRWRLGAGCLGMSVAERWTINLAHVRCSVRCAH